VLLKAFGDADKKYFNDLNDLEAAHDKASFDVIIMCNVLHEVDPQYWLNLFRLNGSLSRLLKEDGVLLLVEDHQIPIGEKAYQNGFLVLDTPQIKELFKISSAEQGFDIEDHKGNGRLKAHIISKKFLIRIDEGSRIAALKATSDNARRKIIKMRQSEKNYQNGKLHGFWVQQFANAELSLALLT
jgi:SAM-dependent methyltransferase